MAIWRVHDYIPILQMNKLRLGEITLIVQGHSTGKEQELNFWFCFTCSNSF